MGFDNLRGALEKRLDEADRGDRAWWLLTRVHVNAARLRAIAQYIYDAAGNNILRLSPAHYERLALLLDVSGANPAQTINRHYLLTMDNPLLLLERINGDRWIEIRLTAAGVRVATDPDTSAVFEDVLRGIRFCREPWYSAERATQYAEFDVRAYPATIATLKLTDGYITTNEFDLFLSRVRQDGEVPAAAEQILEYRGLLEAQQNQLLKLVADRVPGTAQNQKKRYRNWRDMGRHTFALLSLGRSLNQVGNTLRLAGSLVAAAGSEASVPFSKVTPNAAPKAKSSGEPAAPILNLPHAAPSDELLTPPVVSMDNSGAEAELLVGKMLASAGWQVVYYTNRRGFGFDLWARKSNETFVIEIKSSLGALSSIMLTNTEFAAAMHHKLNYLLVLVENLGSPAMVIHVVQDPATSVSSTKTAQTYFVFLGADCRKAANHSILKLQSSSKH